MPEVSVATLEERLAAYSAQQQTRLSRQQHADAAAMDWNFVHGTVGSFADEHSFVSKQTTGVARSVHET